MLVKVYRYTPEDNREYYDSFEVPVPADQNWTVMDTLDYISLHLDSTLSYYKHSTCNHGICGRCSVMVNGKTRLACLEVVNQYSELTLSPAQNRRVIKDLVTRLD